MRVLVGVALTTIVGAGFAAGQEAASPPLADSPLMEDGRLRVLRKPMEQLFQFAFDGRAVVIDRDRWPKTAPEAPKVQPAGANRFGRGRVQATTPIEFVFESMQATALADSKSRSNGYSGGSRLLDRHFIGDELSGRLQLRGDGIRLTLDETQTPKRTFEFTADDDRSFRIQWSHPNGDYLMLHQASSGRFSAVSMTSGRLFAVQSPSYVAFYMKHRQEAETRIAPILAPIGVAPMLSPQSPKLRAAIFDLLRRSPEVVAEGNKLIAQLDDESFAVREKASRALGDRLGQFKDLIETRLKEKSNSPEVQARLESILSSQSKSKGVDECMAAFHLVNDVGYLALLFDHATPSEAMLLNHRLEKTTGRNLGPNPAAWKEWVEKNQK